MIANSSFELSAGLCYLDFRTNKVTMFTGSAGYYHGDHYFMFRPFFIRDNTGWGSSYNFSYRKIQTGMGDYFQINAGFGAVPNERLIQLTGGLAIQTYNMNNQYLGFTYQKLLSDELYSRFDLIFTRQEAFTEPDTYFQIITLGLAIGYRF
jgi:YaiO family outer membrane protein